MKYFKVQKPVKSNTSTKKTGLSRNSSSKRILAKSGNLTSQEDSNYEMI